MKMDSPSPLKKNPKMKIRIYTGKRAMVTHHRILGLVIDKGMNWNNRKHIMRSDIPNTNGNPPTRSQMINRNIYDNYDIKPVSPKPLLIWAAELFGKMDIDGENFRLYKTHGGTPTTEKYGLVSL
jgi:hypothetical protein